jgi:integrase
VKTKTDRRFPLWPETIAAAKEAITDRRDAKDPKDGDLAFLTTQGRPWMRHAAHDDGRIVFTDAVAHELNKVLRKIALKRHGSFYALRHCFRTVADAVTDRPALDLIMGYVDSSMGGRGRFDRVIATVSIELSAIVDAPFLSSLYLHPYRPLQTDPNRALNWL